MAPTFDIALLTDARYERPTNPDWYIQNILDEDALLISALERNHGLSAVRVDWASRDFDWSSVRAAIFRTTWDYFDRSSEFMAWIDRVAPLTLLLNSPELIRWNMDKRYLLDLQSRGVRIPPTVLLERGRELRVRDEMERFGASELIVKPAVSGAARHTYRVNERNAAEVATTVNPLLRNEAFLIQPFLSSVVDQGELSLILMGGVFTHAVRKTAKAGDFRVQDDYGGKVVSYSPTREEIAFAEVATAACGDAPVYARVDIVRDRDGRLAVMEWEGIEPELFMRFCPEAAVRFASEIAARVRR